jgi:hypothetical protein
LNKIEVEIECAQQSVPEVRRGHDGGTRRTGVHYAQANFVESASSRPVHQGYPVKSIRGSPPAIGLLNVCPVS